MSSPSKRNLEKELVLSCNISWKAAKNLTDAVRGRNNGDDAILEAAMSLYEQNPEAYATIQGRRRDSHRDSSESTSSIEATAPMKDDDICDEVEV